MTVVAGFAGTKGGSFVGFTPAFVNLTKRPGTSHQKLALWSVWAHGVLSAKHMIFSPNLIWLLVATVIWLIFPYDFESAQTLAMDWIARRAALNICILFGYYGAVVYGTNAYAQRKFRPDMTPSWVNLAHNIWYSMLGALHWTAWEVLFVHLFATGRLSYVTNDELSGSGISVIAREALAATLIPVWRSFHFYWSHRLLHVPFIYRNVHALHHRNVDIEPFAGLSMHPVEHLYYFSCLAPSLVFRLSPFQMLWNGIHLLLSPAASHSGWEDHVQSDQFHYVHHAKFNCNYGSGSFPLDRFFGTFEDVLHTPAAAEKAAEGAARGERSARGAFKPKVTMAFNVYMIFTTFLFALAFFALFGEGLLPLSALEVLPQLHAATKMYPRAIAAVIAFGPVVGGALITALSGQRLMRKFSDKAMKGKGLPSMYHLPSIMLHLAMGFILGVVPVYIILAAALRDGGEAAREMMEAKM